MVGLARRPVPGAAPGFDAAAPRSVSLDLLRYREIVVASILALALHARRHLRLSLVALHGGPRRGHVFVGVTLALYGVPFILLASAGWPVG